MLVFLFLVDIHFLGPYLKNKHKKILADNPAMLRSLDVYVPLQFSLVPPRPGQTVPLDQSFALETFMQALLFGSFDNIHDCFPMLSRPNKETRVFFIQGFAGAGKSLFCWHAMQYFDREVAASVLSSATYRLPIVVSLPSVKDRVVEAPLNFLIQCILDAYPALVTAFSSLDQGLFARLPFVFFLDSVDELFDLAVISNINRLYCPSQWPESVFVITCRSEVLDSTVISNSLPPRYDFPEGSPQSMLMSSMHLLPFSVSQRNAYISVFAQKYTDLNPGWTAEKYIAALTQFSELDTFVQEPLQLYLVLTVLPILVAGKESTDRCAEHQSAEHAVYIIYQDRDLKKAQELATAIERHPTAVRKGLFVFLKDVCGCHPGSALPNFSLCSRLLALAKVVVPLVSSSVDASTEDFVENVTVAMRLHNSQKTKVCPLFLVPPTKAAEAISVAVSTTAGEKIITLDTLQGKLLKPGEDWSPFVHQIVHEFQSRKLLLLLLLFFFFSIFV